MPVEYYTHILYPLQDKIFKVFAGSPFYLTGGTALSRGYFNHRYSDDLDYFVNDRSDFQKLIEKQIKNLRTLFPDVEVAFRDTDFCRLFVGKDKLKIEMINDVPSHIGELILHPELGVIDSKENITANKITAVIDRALPKDIVDMYFLLKDGLSMKTALTNAESKAAGISPLYIAKILAEFDYGLLSDEIKWVIPVPMQTIKDYLNNIAIALIKGEVK